VPRHTGGQNGGQYDDGRGEGAEDRKVLINCIRINGHISHTYCEELPDGTSVEVSCRRSYDPAADESLESEHKYGRIAGRPEYELAADGAS
jgi:hypothetical protein